MKWPFLLSFLSAALLCGAQEETASDQEPSPSPVEASKESDQETRRWYFEVEPGYYYLTDQLMREFFNTGGFTFRAELGYRFWKPLIVWADGGYFQKKGKAIGSTEDIHIKLASLTVGLKAIHYFHERFAVYGGAGPRLFMMLLDNNTPNIRSEDNKFGFGGGFDAGFWIFPFKKSDNLFFDVFADYSLKTMGTDEDLLSSEDFDVDVSGLSIGIGFGGRF